MKTIYERDKTDSYKLTFWSMIGIILLILILAACETIFPEACEKNHTGEVTLYNKGATAIWVDVTYSDLKRNKLKVLQAKETVTFTMKFGEVFTFAYPVGLIDTAQVYTWKWQKTRLYIPECGNEVYNWYFATKK